MPGTTSSFRGEMRDSAGRTGDSARSEEDTRRRRVPRIHAVLLSAMVLCIAGGAFALGVSSNAGFSDTQGKAGASPAGPPPLHVTLGPPPTGHDGEPTTTVTAPPTPGKSASTTTVGKNPSSTTTVPGSPGPTTTVPGNPTSTTTTVPGGPPPPVTYGALTIGPIEKMVQGDQLDRVVELTNNINGQSAGAMRLDSIASLSIQTSPTGTDRGADIVTDATNGIHVTLSWCKTDPIESGGANGPWTYSCPGGWQSTGVTNTALGNLDTTPVDITPSAPGTGGSVYYEVQLTLPSVSNDSYGFNNGQCSTGGTPGVSEQLQNCTLSITFNFTATQLP